MHLVLPRASLSRAAAKSRYTGSDAFAWQRRQGLTAATRARSPASSERWPARVPGPVGRGAAWQLAQVRAFFPVECGSKEDQRLRESVGPPAAVLYRLLHHSHTLVMQGESHRLKRRSRAELIGREPTEKGPA